MVRGTTGGSPRCAQVSHSASLLGRLVGPGALRIAGPRMASEAESARPQGGLAALSIAALGVVYGDIGTSPLYAIRECFHGPHAVAATAPNVLGVLSLIVWSLIMVVSVKYL